MDIGNFERIDREQRQRSSPPELALTSAAEDRRVPVQKKNDKLSVIFLLQTLFALFVTAAILLSSGGYLGDTPETLPNDIAEDAATRTLSSLYERWFGGTDASGSSLPESDAGSGAQSEAVPDSPDENSENGSEDQPHTEKLSSGIKYAALYPREITRSGLSGSLRIPAAATLAPIATTARAESPITGWDRSTVNSGFGYRTHPITGKLDFHTGLDIPADYGEAIRAVFPGVVAEVGRSDIFGNYVVLEHTSGTRTRYCHCSLVAAAEGTRVRAGETIAYVGSTGVSTGAHLHLDLIVNGLYSDPRWLFSAPFSTSAE